MRELPIVSPLDRLHLKRRALTSVGRGAFLCVMPYAPVKHHRQSERPSVRFSADRALFNVAATTGLEGVERVRLLVEQRTVAFVPAPAGDVEAFKVTRVGKQATVSLGHLSRVDLPFGRTLPLMSESGRFVVALDSFSTYH